MKLVEGSTLRSKLIATNEEERLQKWKENIKNMLGNSPEITDQPTEEINQDQLDI